MPSLTNVLVLQKQISGWGSVLGVSVCKVIEAKSVVMLVNDLKTECNTWVDFCSLEFSLFFDITNIVLYWTSC